MALNHDGLILSNGPFIFFKSSAHQSPMQALGLVFLRYSSCRDQEKVLEN